MAVGVESLHALLKGIARHVEVAGSTFRRGDDRHTEELSALVVSGMSLQQIVHKHGTHAKGLTLLTTSIETTGHVIISPVHTVNTTEEEIDIHDTGPAVTPALRGVVV